MSGVSDGWAAGSTYEDFMGRWSRRLATQFVSWLNVPGGVHWLDVGCGTGALTDAICSGADPASVLGCDPSEPFVEYARAHSRDNRASFAVAGAGGLPPRAGGYGCVSSSLALNFFPDAGAALGEMRALAAPGGTVSACVWDYAGGMEFLRRFWDAASLIDEGSRALDEGSRFPICRPGALTELFRSSGLRGVSCEPVEVRTEFAGFDDYWRPFLGGTGPAPSYVASLDTARRTELARRLDETLPRATGGTIVLTARAWAVRGSAE
jgi:SAM-dependent methyltransferase